MFTKDDFSSLQHAIQVTQLLIKTHSLQEALHYWIDFPNRINSYYSKRFYNLGYCQSMGRYDKKRYQSLRLWLSIEHLFFPLFFFYQSIFSETDYWIEPLRINWAPYQSVCKSGHWIRLPEMGNLNLLQKKIVVVISAKTIEVQSNEVSYLRIVH